MQIGVGGYGTGGRHFHTPFIAAASNCALVGIVAHAPKTIAAAMVRLAQDTDLRQLKPDERSANL